MSKGCTALSTHIKNTNRRGNPCGCSGRLRNTGLGRSRGAPLRYVQPSEISVGQRDGQQDSGFVAEAPGDVAVAGQVLGDEDIAGAHLVLGAVGALELR